MNKNIKYALVFTSGVTVGLGVCGVKVLNYALNDEHIRDAIKHKISDKLDKALYGDSCNKQHRAGYVSYHRYAEEKRRPRATRDKVENLVFATRLEAEKTLDEIKEIIDKYGYVTVAELYELSGAWTDYTNNLYGWLSADGFEIRSVQKVGYELVVPKAILIR